MAKPISKTQTKGKIPLRVELNGTTINPYLRFGLTINPFPQIAKKELMPAMMQLNRLAAEPIPMNNAAIYIRSVLTGWSDEFVDLCVAAFVPGERSRFTVWLEPEWVGEGQNEARV